MYEQKPWLKFYGDVPKHIDYPRVTMYEALMQTVSRSPDTLAYDFFGYTATYRQFGAEIDRCADALAALGLKQGDRITISMPTCPQGIICFYAANKLGAVASMIHPLSPAKEIEFYLNTAKSRFALTIDAFYGKFKAVQDKTDLQTLILCRIPDYLPLIKKIGFNLTKGRKIPPVPEDNLVVWWSDLMKEILSSGAEGGHGYGRDGRHPLQRRDNGRPEGDHALQLQLHQRGDAGLRLGEAWEAGTAMLAILPIFHGFGLGVCINAIFMGGGKSILVPQFTPEIVADLIKKKRPNFVVGVPTLFEALCSNPVFQKADLSCLRATFSGADTLPRPVKERFEAVVKERGGNVQLLEGYGLTEAVTAIMATPLNQYREGSVGIPFPDMLAKIVKTGTTEEAPVGEEGEICLNGPAVMLGYLDQPEETANTLKTHADGKVWLHTGDIGTMDADGFFYFRLRQKRMIKSSGMNVYPAQVEDVLYRHPDVLKACVIGVPDEKQVQRVKGFVVLKEPAKAGPGDGEGAHRPLPGAPDPLELPPGDRVPERPPLHAGRQGRLQRPRGGGDRQAEGRGEILRAMIPDRME